MSYKQRLNLLVNAFPKSISYPHGYSAYVGVAFDPWVYVEGKSK